LPGARDVTSAQFLVSGSKLTALQAYNPRTTAAAAVDRSSEMFASRFFTPVNNDE